MRALRWPQRGGLYGVFCLLFVCATSTKRPCVFLFFFLMFSSCFRDTIENLSGHAGPRRAHLSIVLPRRPELLSERYEYDRAFVLRRPAAPAPPRCRPFVPGKGKISSDFKQPLFRMLSFCRQPPSLSLHTYTKSAVPLSPLRGPLFFFVQYQYSFPYFFSIFFYRVRTECSRYGCREKHTRSVPPKSNLCCVQAARNKVAVFQLASRPSK